MRRLCALLLVLAGCRGERAGTATIAPAEPRPAPTAAGTLEDLPMVTTSGSPVPPSAVAPGTQLVTVSGSGISMRSLIPRGQTAFRITNETSVQHELVLRGANGLAEPVSVPARGTAVVQARITGDRYELRCETPGHAERAEFATYAAGTPLNVSSARR